MPRNRLMILEDHPLVREAMESMLVPSMGDIEMAYNGDSIDEALVCIAESSVDLVILDLDLNNGRSPLENLDAIVSTGTAVIVISALGDPATVRACITAGALGFVSKQAKPSEIVQALKAALRGEPTLSSDVAVALVSAPPSHLDLSDQERRAMVLYASGLKMEAVARRMNIARSTAEEYIKRVRVKARKAGTPMPTKTDMYRVAQREGMLP